MPLLDKIAARLGYAPTRQQTKQVPRPGRTRGYNAGLVNRLTADWTTQFVSEDSEARRTLLPLRARARDLARNDDYAKGFLTVLKSNVIGPCGINLQMDVTEQRFNAATGQTDYLSDNLANDLIEAGWLEFSKPENFSVQGNISRSLFEALTMETTARDGEFIVRLVTGFDNPFGFAVQPLEVDQLDESFNLKQLENGNEVRLGVELDKWRRRVAFWLREGNPSDDFYYSSSYKRLRIPADEIIHGFIPSYLQQTRGVTWFHTSAPRIKMLSGYEEAELTAARAAASKMGFLEQPADTEEKEYSGDAVDENGNLISEFEPGTIEQLPSGMTFKGFDPAHPHTNFNEFRKGILRGVAAGLGVSYNTLASDLEAVNYSSLRAGSLSERDIWLMLQGWFISTFESRVFKKWLEMSLLKGVINLPAAKFDKFHSPRFVGRRWSWVDPAKDVKAAADAVALRIRTRTQIVNEAGGNMEDVFRDSEKEQQLADKYNVPLEPAKPTPVPAPADDPADTVDK